MPPIPLTRIRKGTWKSHISISLNFIFFYKLKPKISYWDLKGIKKTFLNFLFIYLKGSCSRGLSVMISSCMNLIYVNLHVPTCPRDFTVTISLKMVSFLLLLLLYLKILKSKYLLNRSIFSYNFLYNERLYYLDVSCKISSS